MTSHKPKILLITEGDTEDIFYHRLAQLFNLKFEIVTINCNIYSIYQYIIDNDPEFVHILSIKDVVREVARDKSDKDKLEDELKLQDNYTYTYLFYDFDIHHPINDGQVHSFDEIVSTNISKLAVMINYFTDESDDTMGKLFINYPMMESYKDLDSFDDKKYYTKDIDVIESQIYKGIVNRSKLGSISCEKLEYDDFKSIIKLNYKKAALLLNIGNISNNNFLDVVDGCKLFNFQKNHIDSVKKISVLNTSVLFYVEYKKDFYNEWKDELIMAV